MKLAPISVAAHRARHAAIETAMVIIAELEALNMNDPEHRARVFDVNHELKMLVYKHPAHIGTTSTG